MALLLNNNTTSADDTAFLTKVAGLMGQAYSRTSNTGALSQPRTYSVTLYILECISSDHDYPEGLRIIIIRLENR